MGKAIKTIKDMTDAELENIRNRVCPCCLLEPELVEFPLCCNLSDMGELGSGYVSFFYLAKLCFWICFLFGMANIYKVRANWGGNNCSSQLDPTSQSACRVDWITIHSIANYGYGIDYTDKGIIIAFFGLILLILIFYYPHLKNLGEKLDLRTDMPSDWTVEVT